MELEWVSEEYVRYGEKDDPQTYAIIGAAMEVHSHLGFGLNEAAYQEALEIECELRGISVQREVHVPLYYKGRQLKTCFRLDLLADQCVIIETKAISKWSGTEEGQVLSYLRATKLKKALLLNFGTERLGVKRISL